MKRKFIAALSLAACLSASPRNKIDLSGQATLDDYRMKLELSHKNAPAAVRETSEMISAIVTLSDGASRAELEEKGYNVVAGVGSMVIVSLPISEVETLADLKCVERISFGNKMRTMLNNARSASLIDPVQTGESDGLLHAFTGDGILTSLYDTGLQPNNINFKKADGSSRVKALWESKNGKLSEYTTDAAIAAYDTDNSSSTHGTHVLGCMSGSYNGEGIYAGDSNPTEGNIPFYGVAVNSDILIGCGSLNDADILAGVDRIVNYAKNEARPLVLNLSLGSNYGPHDGSSTFCRMLAEYGKECIISVAAGNEGADKIAVLRKFSAINRQLKTFITPSEKNVAYNGIVDFYSSDPDVLEFSLVLYDTAGKEIAYEFPINENTNGAFSYLASSSFSNPDYTYSDIFDESYGAQSYIRVATEIDPNNNRYHVRVEPSLRPGSNNQIVLGVVVKGKSGVTVNGYANSLTDNVELTFSNNNVSGWQDGTRNGSISDLACSDNVIVIGAYNTRSRWRALNGGSYSYNDAAYDVGAISPFSSFGDLYDGRSLPTICAPGAGIVSSLSSAYISATGVDPQSFVAQASDSKGTYYWGVQQGTSMASPIAAGTIALWLEADPTLTISEVIEIAKTTAIRDAGVLNTGSSTQWGAGKIDALAGIKKILESSGIGSIAVDGNDDKSLVVTTDGNGLYDIFVAGAAKINAKLYSVNGTVAAESHSDSSEVRLDASSIAGGVYILRVTTPNTVHSRKILVR